MPACASPALPICNDPVCAAKRLSPLWETILGACEAAQVTCPHDAKGAGVTAPRLPPGGAKVAELRRCSFELQRPQPLRESGGHCQARW